MADVLSAVLLVAGGAVMLLAGVGVVRMPDLFSRMQAATKASSLGVGCLVLAGAVHFGDLAVAARAVLVIAFVFLTAPVAAHLIARAAYADGTPLWEGTIADELRAASPSRLPAPQRGPGRDRAPKFEGPSTAPEEG
jgi:multicomponent Na+:H+ antiporter subunit G